MSHPSQRQFCKWVKRQHPIYFTDSFVVDVGSLSINGDNRSLFCNFWDKCRYWGIDIIAGKNVDIVGKAHEVLPNLYSYLHSKDRWIYKLEDFIPDVVISSECMEHNSYWKETLTEMYRVLKPRGLFIMTCAAPGRLPHGTTEHHAWCSPATNDYYSNISIEDFAEVLPPKLFKEYYLTHDKRNNDIFFYGLRA